MALGKKVSPAKFIGMVAAGLGVVQGATQIVGDAKSKAEDEAEKIITSGSKNLENEINKTKEQLRSDLSEIVVDTAQKIIDAEIDPGKHEEIIKKAAKEI